MRFSKRFWDTLRKNEPTNESSLKESATNLHYSFNSEHNLPSPLSPDKTVSTEEKTNEHDRKKQIEDDSLYGYQINRLSVRAHGVLVRFGINDIRSFLDLSPAQLFQTKNCGRKTVHEILNLQTSIRDYLNISPTKLDEISAKSGTPSPLHLEGGENKFDQDAIQTISNAPYCCSLENENDIDDNYIDFNAFELSVRARNVLAQIGIDHVKSFFELSFDQLFKTKNCGRKTIHEILALQKSLQDHLGIKKSPSEKLVDKPKPLTFTNSMEEKKFFQAMVETLSYRASNLLKAKDVGALEQFMSLTKSQMLSWRNCGRKTVIEIITIQKKIEKLMRSALENDAPLFNEKFWSSFFLASSSINQFETAVDSMLVDPNSPYHSLYDWVASFCKSEKERRIFLLRKGMIGMRPMTLEKIGGLLDLTRERVRQIEATGDKKASEKVQQMRLRPLINLILDLVQKRGGKISNNDLVSLLLVRGDNGDKLRYAAPFIDFLSSLEVWKETDLQLDENDMVFSKESMSFINRIAPVINHIAQNNADEIIEADLWSIDCKLLKHHIVEWFNNTYGNDPLCGLSNEILNDSLKKSKAGLKRKKDRYYSLNLWRLRYGSLNVSAETILRRAKSAMHFSQVYQEMRKFRSIWPGSSEHNVHATLDRSENVFLSDRATFIHRDCVTIPLNLIGEVEQWLELKLREDIPFVSAYGAFKAFESKCNNAKITSETALYTCLRKAANPNLIYPRYPSIYLRSNYIDRLPMLIVIEQFIQESGGPVSFEELKAFVINGLCLKEFQLNQLIASLSTVVRTEGGGFLHTDYLKIESKYLDELVAYAQECAGKEGHVSARKIFNDKIISCKMIKIDSPRMLYSAF